jgi:DNA-binding CsgD family transcriptional regulator
MFIRLTPREQQIIPLLAKGYTRQRIAKELGIGHDTIKSHINRMFKKCRVNTSMALVVCLIRAGMYDVHTGELVYPYGMVKNESHGSAAMETSTLQR